MSSNVPINNNIRLLFTKSTLCGPQTKGTLAMWPFGRKILCTATTKDAQRAYHFSNYVETNIHKTICSKVSYSHEGQELQICENEVRRKILEPT